MKDLEKQIEEAAETNANSLSKTINLDELDFIIANNAFITGAKSPEAKEYWIDLLCSEIIENKTFFDFASKCASKKYEIGSKEHTIATMSIKFGMGCFLTKEYWQQGMYTKEKVESLFIKLYKENSPYSSEKYGTISIISDSELKVFLENNLNK